MQDNKRLYKASWVASFKVNFEEGQYPLWQYHKIKNDEYDWSAKSCKVLSENGERTKLLDRVEKLRKNKIWDAIRKKLKKDEDIFSWLPSRKNNNPALKDAGVAILLNHIIIAMSSKPLVNIVSLVNTHRVVEIRGLLPDQPAWAYVPPDQEKDTPIWEQLLGNYILGFPDLFLEDGHITIENRIKKIKDFLKAHRQKTKITVLRYQVEKKSCILQIQLDTLLCMYARGSLCNCIPIPGHVTEKTTGDSEEPLGVFTPEVVITSPAVELALSALSDVWQDKAKTILVSGPPGSGKENFALSIPYGSGRKGDFIQKISLANSNRKEQESLIFGCKQDDGSIIDGLIAKGEGSSIFVDEAHYPMKKPGIRASLLRVLESNEYYPINSLEPRKIKDLQWIFASSLPVDGKETCLAQLIPTDFWTRMTHIVRIEHPLDPNVYYERGDNDIETQSNQKEVIKDLFKYFWWERTKSHFGIDPVKVLTGEKATADIRETDVADELLRRYVKLMLEEQPLITITEIFADTLIGTVGSNALAGVSIRGIRGMVSRIFSKCVGHITGGLYKNLKELITKGNDLDNKKLRFNIREEMIRVICEIQQIAQLKS